MRNIKHINVLALGLLIALSILIFDFSYKIDPQDALDISFNKLEEAYQQDSQYIRVASSYVELEELVGDSKFSILIKDKSDSLVYWNKAYAKQKEDYTKHWRKRFFLDTTVVELHLDLFDGTHLDLSHVLAKEFLPRYEYVYRRSGTISVPIEGQDLKLEVSSSHLKSKWHNYLLVFWYLSLLMISFVLSINYKNNQINGLFPLGLKGWTLYSLSIILLYIGSGYLLVDYLFGAHSFSLFNGEQKLDLDLLSFASLLAGLFFLVEGLKRDKVQSQWDKVHTVLKYFIGSVFVNGLMFFVILQAERFIKSGDVFVNIEEILNIEYRTIFFLMIMLGYSLVYFYLSSILFKIKSESQGKISSRIIGHTLGVIGMALVYLQLGGSTPVIPITLLLVTFFLIQDLYEEFNARNLTFVLINAILFSALMSVVIFYSALQKNKTERYENIKTVMGVLNNKELLTTQNIRDTLIASNLIPSLASLTYPSPMDRNELMSYIDNIVSSVDTSNLFDVEAVECYDQVGNSLFFNHISNYQNNNELIINSKRLDNNLYHLPLNNVTSIFFQINNDDFPYSPINMIIKLAKPDWSNKIQLEENNYLVYKDNSLIYSFSNDFLDIDREDPSILMESKDIGDMSYVVYSPDEEYKIIDYQEVSGLIKPISFFSLIFIICGILLGLFTLVNSRLKILPDELDFTFYSQSSLRSKIQLSVILLIVFSFFVIGIITTVYFKNIVSFNDRSKFKSDLKTIINDVQNKLTETLDAESAANIISKEFSELENIYSRRFAYFNDNGRRVIKSQRYDDAYNYIPYGILHSFTGEESTIKSVSLELEDEQVLIPIYLKEYQPQGFLTMHYSSRRSISSGIYNHLANLMNVYIFLFFLAGALSIFIANSITEPLARLREGVKKFKLGKTNEPLQYDSNDELGVLIKEYNNMTEQLEHSASIIAKTERDMAWREMAKQVAHEIKNPLTPMKLHLQHLENTVRSSPERAQEMIKKVSITLIEQINNLTNIANEFSNYATLPKADNIKTNLNEVVEHVHDLFRERDDMDINMDEPIDDLIVFADRNHLVRIVVNIIKNAIQSIPQERRGKIDISLEKIDSYAKLSISDNGSGIPDHMKNKIFTPNFTTKSSGTGLGLAICVNMLDTMNGKIYFESEENVGTTFFIEIPIMRKDFSHEEDEIFLED